MLCSCTGPGSGRLALTWKSLSSSSAVQDRCMMSGTDLRLFCPGVQELCKRCARWSACKLVRRVRYFSHSSGRWRFLSCCHAQNLPCCSPRSSGQSSPYGLDKVHEPIFPVRAPCTSSISCKTDAAGHLPFTVRRHVRTRVSDSVSVSAVL